MRQAAGGGGQPRGGGGPVGGGTSQRGKLEEGNGGKAAAHPCWYTSMEWHLVHSPGGTQLWGVPSVTLQPSRVGTLLATATQHAACNVIMSAGAAAPAQPAQILPATRSPLRSSARSLGPWRPPSPSCRMQRLDWRHQIWRPPSCSSAWGPHWRRRASALRQTSRQPPPLASRYDRKGFCMKRAGDCIILRTMNTGYNKGSNPKTQKQGTKCRPKMYPPAALPSPRA